MNNELPTFEVLLGKFEHGVIRLARLVLLKQQHLQTLGFVSVPLVLAEFDRLHHSEKLAQVNRWSIEEGNKEYLSSRLRSS